MKYYLVRCILIIGSTVQCWRKLKDQSVYVEKFGCKYIKPNILLITIVGGTCSGVWSMEQMYSLILGNVLVALNMLLIYSK